MKLPFVIKYVPNICKIPEICDKVILENGRTLMFVPDRYKNQKVCYKAVDNYPNILEFVRFV